MQHISFSFKPISNECGVVQRNSLKKNKKCHVDEINGNWGDGSEGGFFFGFITTDNKLSLGGGVNKVHHVVSMI